MSKTVDPRLLYANIASGSTPAPGGVGPVTVANLMPNAARELEKQISLRCSN